MCDIRKHLKDAFFYKDEKSGETKHLMGSNIITAFSNKEGKNRDTIYLYVKGQELKLSDLTSDIREKILLNIINSKNAMNTVSGIIPTGPLYNDEIIHLSVEQEVISRINQILD